MSPATRKRTSISLIIGLGLTTILSYVLWSAETHAVEVEAKDEFNRQVDLVKKTVTLRVQSNLDLLAAGKSFWLSSVEVTPTEWRRFIEGVEIKTRYPSILGMGVIFCVSQDSVSFHTASYSEKYLRHPLTPNFAPKPASDPHPTRYIISIIEPLEPNLQALGYDVGSEALRREAAELALKTGRATSTAPIVLVQDHERTPGFLIMDPLPDGGFIYAPFRAKDLFKDVLSQSNVEANILDVEVFDGPPREGRIIYDDDNYPHAADPNWRSDFARTESVQFAVRPWTLYFTTLPGYRMPGRHLPWVAMGSGLLVGLLATGLLVLYSTRQERAEDLVELRTQDLRSSEQRLKTVLESAVDGIVTIDSKGIVLSWNRAAERIFGFRQEEMLGANIRKVMPEPFHSEHDGYLKRYLETGRARIIGVGREVTGLRKDGTAFPVDLAVNELPLESGKHFVGILRDITERHRTNEELRAAKSQAEEATRAKSEFLANMSHEIRTPMNAIVGLSSILAEAPLAQEHRNQARVVHRAGENLLEIINDILDLSRVESGLLKLEIKDFSLSEILASVADVLGFRAREKGLEVSWGVSPGVPEFFKGDPVRIRQVLMNLAGNAVKFTERGSVNVGVSPDASSPGRYVFSITDTGIGIPAEAAAKLFERFSQVDSSATRTHEGTGLGLAISKHLVELMGGSIRVESTPGRGSTFTFSLPLAPGERLAATVVPEVRPPRPLRILLVENNEDNRALVQAYLAGQGHTLEVALDGRQAIDMTLSSNFDVVLMDVQMPVMDGLTATRCIRQAEMDTGRGRTPIAALTAHALEADRRRSLEAGCDLHLVKPLTRESLWKALTSLTGGLPPAATGPSRRVPPAVVPLIPKFLENRRKDVEKLRELLAKGDFKGIDAIAHNIKGLGTGYGYPDMTEAALKLEEAASLGDAGACLAQIETLSTILSSPRNPS